MGQTSALNLELRDQIVQTAHRQALGLPHDSRRPAAPVPGINHKRVYRIYTAEGLSIRKRKKAKRIGVHVPLVAAMASTKLGYGLRQ